MFKLLAAFFELLGLIIKSEQKRERERDQEAHQEKVDEAREDPAEAFDEHFNHKKKGDH